MARVDKPTQDDILRIAGDPVFALEAIERWGIDAVTDPQPIYEMLPCGCKHGVGLGDVVKTVASWFGVRPCSACEERRRKLNRWRIGG